MAFGLSKGVVSSSVKGRLAPNDIIIWKCVLVQNKTAIHAANQSLVKQSRVFETWGTYGRGEMVPVCFVDQGDDPARILDGKVNIEYGSHRDTHASVDPRTSGVPR